MDKGSVVFAKAATPDGVPMIILGIHPDAVEYMKDGKTNNFDLTKLGVPVRIMIFGAESQEAAIRLIEQGMAQSGRGIPLVDATDLPGQTFSIDPKDCQAK